MRRIWSVRAAYEANVAILAVAMWMRRALFAALIIIISLQIWIKNPTFNCFFPTNSACSCGTRKTFSTFSFHFVSHRLRMHCLVERNFFNFEFFAPPFWGHCASPLSPFSHRNPISISIETAEGKVSESAGKRRKFSITVIVVRPARKSWKPNPTSHLLWRVWGEKAHLGKSLKISINLITDPIILALHSSLPPVKHNWCLSGI